MIRWYDVILAFLLASSIFTFLMFGIVSNNIWESLLFGFIAGLLYRVWVDDYCNFRKKQEENCDRV